MDRLVDFVHVGDYKTGTSWLQETVFPLHQEIQYLGDYFDNSSLQQVLRRLVDTRDLDFDANELRDSFVKNHKREENKIVGISREALSQSNYITGEHARRNAERLVKVFGKIKVIYVIREQVSMLGAIYSQYIKMGGTRSFEDWFLDPVETLGIIERLKYHKNIAMYHELFGKENVLVLIFEELKEDKASFLKKIYQHIGCEDIDFQPLESRKVVNQSLTGSGAFFARFFHRFFRNSYHNFRSTSFMLDKLIYLLASKAFLDRRDRLSLGYVIPNYGDLDRRQRVLYSINMGIRAKIEAIAAQLPFGRKVTVPKKTVEEIWPLFSESNMLLKEAYFLDIEKYGWSL